MFLLFGSNFKVIPRNEYHHFVKYGFDIVDFQVRKKHFAETEKTVCKQIQTNKL